MTLFEKVANSVVIAAAVLVVGLNIHDRLVPPVSPDQSLVNHYLGKRLPVPASTPSGKKGTISIFLSKDCHYCSESMGFYRRLADLRAESACKLVAFGPNSREKRPDVQAYLAGNGLSVDGLEMVDFSSLSVPGTPTLFVQDGDRQVRGVWVGKLSESKETDVLARVKSVCQL